MSLTLSPNGSLVSQLSQEEADTFLNTSASSAQPDQPYDGGLYGTPYALNAFASPQAKIVDALAPQMTSLSLNRSTFNVSYAYALITLTVGFTDDLSGISSAEISLIAPNGTIVTKDSIWMVNGSTLNGTISGQLIIPENAVHGSYSIKVTLYDAVGRSTTYETADDLFGVNLNVMAYPSDTLAPQIKSLSLSTTHVDVSNGYASVNVTVGFTDNLSGISYDGNSSIAVWLVGPDGKTVVTDSLYSPDGSTNDGTMSGTLRIPQYAQAGDYSITVLLRDVVGNTVRYEHADELFGLNFHASSSQTDTAAPRVTGLSLGQYEINVSGTSRDVDVAVSFSDNLSGVASATAWLIGPDGNVVAGNRLWDLSGTTLSGTMSGTLTVPRYAQTGDYSVKVALRDAVGNIITVANVDSNFGVNLHVSDQNDTQAPSLTSLTLSQSEVNVSGSEAQVEATVGYRDTLSGIGSARMWLVAPDGTKISEAEIWEWGGDEFNGTVTGVFTIPQNAPAGLYSVSVLLEDAPGNAIEYQHVGGPFDVNLVVLDEMNLPPVGSPTASLSSGAEDIAYSVKTTDLLKGLSDPNNDALTVTGLTSSTGTVVDNGNGTFTITPTANFNGTVKLTYSVADGDGGTLAGQTRSYVVAPVNDAPTAVQLSNASVREAAANGTVVGRLTGTDLDGPSLKYSLVDSAGGRFAIVGNELRVANGLMLDFEQSAGYTVRVSVTDSAGGTFARSIAVGVVNVSPESITGDAAANKLIGGVSNDTFSGLAGNDQLTGGAGNDRLNGGAGADVLLGQAGNDIYDVDNASDQVSEAGGSGLDLVQSSVSFSLSGAKVLGAVENLTLTGTAAINGTGNTLANAIVGNAAANSLYGAAGNDQLTGGAGNDRLNGGAGADVMLGQAGNDIYDVDNALDQVSEAGGSGLDLVQSSVSFSLSGAKALGDLENLTLTGTAAINGTGNALANAIVGNAAANSLDGGTGNDRLTGGAGNDRLIGGAGADVMLGQAGNDIYDVDNASDQVSEAGGSGLDLVQSSVSFSLSGAKVLGAVEKSDPHWDCRDKWHR